MFAKHLLTLFLVFQILFCNAQEYTWQKLENSPDYPGKQDDIHFINPDTGWYVNGSGKIYHTKNGGEDWELIFEQPGTFFRCVGFIDEKTGFAGNIGTDYFPNVSDTIPLYKTTDGGKSWTPVKYSGPTIKGLCALEIIKVPYSNHGTLDYKHHIIAGGRVGSPAFLLRSENNGETWKSQDMSEYCGYIMDIKFFNEKEGMICAGTNASFDRINALILRTEDGGRTWNKVYQSERPYEITWKASFPTDDVGYVTVQSYNPDTNVSQRFVAKTTDNGKTWKELPLVDDYSCREFGVGFINENTGWVGSMHTGYLTTDGGKTWQKTEMGKAVNKIRILETEYAYICYAIGANVYKLLIKE